MAITSGNVVVLTLQLVHHWQAWAHGGGRCPVRVKEMRDREQFAPFGEALEQRRVRMGKGIEEERDERCPSLTVERRDNHPTPGLWNLVRFGRLLCTNGTQRVKLQQ